MKERMLFLVQSMLLASQELCFGGTGVMLWRDRSHALEGQESCFGGTGAMLSENFTIVKLSLHYSKIITSL